MHSFNKQLEPPIQGSEHPAFMEHVEPGVTSRGQFSNIKINIKLIFYTISQKIIYGSWIHFDMFQMDIFENDILNSSKKVKTKLFLLAYVRRACWSTGTRIVTSLWLWARGAWIQWSCTCHLNKAGFVIKFSIVWI